MCDKECRGDPAQLLKSVNPSEAGILDAASKCHIRFRLGGDVFYQTYNTSIEIPSANLLQDLLPRLRRRHQRLRAERLREDQEAEAKAHRQHQVRQGR
jgi:hypothetical protein